MMSIAESPTSSSPEARDPGGLGLSSWRTGNGVGLRGRLS